MAPVHSHMHGPRQGETGAREDAGWVWVGGQWAARRELVWGTVAVGHCSHGAPRPRGTARPKSTGPLDWTPAGMCQLQRGGAVGSTTCNCPSPGGKEGSGGQECGRGWRLQGRASAAGCRRCLAASPIPSLASPSPAPRRPLLLPLLPPPRPLPALAAATTRIFWGSGETGPAAATAAVGHAGDPAQPSPRMHIPLPCRDAGRGPPEQGREGPWHAAVLRRLLRPQHGEQVYFPGPRSCSAARAGACALTAPGAGARRRGGGDGAAGCWQLLQCRARRGARGPPKRPRRRRHHEAGGCLPALRAPWLLLPALVPREPRGSLQACCAVPCHTVGPTQPFPHAVMQVSGGLRDQAHTPEPATAQGHGAGGLTQ